MEKSAAEPSQADPNGAAPTKVETDPAYRVVQNKTVVAWPGNLGVLIVQHLRTKTFWRASFHIGDEDSEADWPARWVEVFPREMVITEYVTNDKKS